MKNKRGSLLPEETVKIIVGAVVIIILIGLLVALYFAFTKNVELEQAKSSLEYLIQRIEAGDSQIEIWNPLNWWIVSWPKSTKIILPIRCKDKGWQSCICIQKDSIKENSLGFCLESDIKIFQDQYSVNPQGGETKPIRISINEIEIAEIPMSFFIKRDESTQAKEINYRIPWEPSP